mmetsp:Transcript_19532/g.28101  ORF Transcript_19532/g.28101 Transcript_19532/m.28101 type:complete len:256 (+) Transcript_19532:109-876(+)
MGKYSFLASLIAVVLVEYAVLIACFGFTFRNIESVFEHKEFNIVARSRYGKRGNCALLVARLLFCGWFSVTTLYKYSSNDPNLSSGWHYYTNWNLILISIYFMLASFISSFDAFRNYDDTFSASIPALRRVSLFVGIVYPVICSTAIMVTVLNFTLLDSNLGFWDITSHLTQSISLIFVEMPLSKALIKPHDVWVVITWPLIYLIFIWPIVATDVREWPYFFLETNRPTCFIWYTALLLFSILFFCINMHDTSRI